jgi:hypothetical protein
MRQLYQYLAPGWDHFFIPGAHTVVPNPGFVRRMADRSAFYVQPVEGESDHAMPIEVWYRPVTSCEKDSSKPKRLGQC